MKVAVHNHFNARKICDVEIAADAAARLSKPPKLKDNWVTTADGQRFNMVKPEDHVVTVGSLRLFTARVNGVDLVVTDTPTAAIALAA